MKTGCVSPVRPDAVNNARIVPVILAGGKGARLRPLTSDTRPKPFLKVNPFTSLLQDTVLRVKTFHPPVVACEERFAERVTEQIHDIDCSPWLVIAEPEGRGTAAAIALAALALESSDKVILVMPSDHFVEDEAVFVRATQKAVAAARDAQGPVIIGIEAGRAATRYGYIEAAADGSGGVLPVKKFIEKPCAQKARAFIATGNCFWNSGIFAVRPDVFLSMMQSHASEILVSVNQAFEASKRTGNILFPHFSSCAEMHPLSVDHAVMEKCDTARMVLLETQWSDVGCLVDFLKARFWAYFACMTQSASSLLKRSMTDWR